MATAAVWILVVWVLAFAIKWPLLVALVPSGKYNNKHPRDQQAKLEGWHKLLIAAHSNALEGFPGFAAAMLLGAIAGLPESTLAGAGTFYASSRLVYTLCYVKKWHWARSGVWLAGWIVICGLMLSAALS
ncbi:MAG: MAPEG family protein [Bdellovibrionales bacterium]|nr:MAPEG family protein [Bdellovibrionales bacterium]